MRDSIPNIGLNTAQTSSILFRALEHLLKIRRLAILVRQTPFGKGFLVQVEIVYVFFIMEADHVRQKLEFCDVLITK